MKLDSANYLHIKEIYEFNSYNELDHLGYIRYTGYRIHNGAYLSLSSQYDPHGDKGTLVY